ncbi:sialic acid-binding Ig-like lectin 16 [Poeciliopsis prolifica]|uniref:sialic acid-binding Ig-like lectin 16 n=1 Tax=Poeciliopsis prolifica TaxID=188132 RepID=UPI00241362B3|nr:sialic acid-binding Ig-like lectin 16 [Poeciliopsis prolifica]
MELKLWLPILIVFGMAESLGTSKDWSIKVPSKIPVLQGSCVDIPCRYKYPKTKKILNRWRGFWKRGNTLVASSFPSLKLTDEFHKRTRMSGYLQSGNCSWQLFGVRTTDTGPFHFRIELPQHKSNSFLKNMVTLNVFRVPAPPVMTVAVQDKVTATCTVTHVCPSSPPKFSWNHYGKRETKSKKPANKWLWKTTSTLTFTPEESDFNKPIICTVTFFGRKTTKGSVIPVKKKSN